MNVWEKSILAAFTVLVFVNANAELNLLGSCTCCDAWHIGEITKINEEILAYNENFRIHEATASMDEKRIRREEKRERFLAYNEKSKSLRAECKRRNKGNRHVDYDDASISMYFPLRHDSHHSTKQHMDMTQLVTEKKAYEKAYQEKYAENKTRRKQRSDTLDTKYRSDREECRGYYQRQLREVNDIEIKTKIRSQRDLALAKLKNSYESVKFSQYVSYKQKQFNNLKELREKGVELRKKLRELCSGCETCEASAFPLRIRVFQLEKFPVSVSLMYGHYRHVFKKKLGVSLPGGYTDRIHYVDVGNFKDASYLNPNMTWTKENIERFISDFESVHYEESNTCDMIQFCVYGKLVDDDGNPVAGYSLKRENAQGLGIRKYSFVSDKADVRTFFHEFGHCLLNQGNEAHHVPEELKAVSLMAQSKDSQGLDFSEKERKIIRDNLHLYYEKRDLKRIERGLLSVF